MSPFLRYKKVTLTVEYREIISIKTSMEIILVIRYYLPKAPQGKQKTRLLVNKLITKHFSKAELVYCTTDW